jgi:hypothetical protein
MSLATLLSFKLCWEFTTVWSVLIELVGIGYVYRQINSKRLSFGQPKLLSSAASWLIEFPKIFRAPKTILMAGSASLGLIAGTARGRVTSSSQSSSIFDRMQSTERNISLLHEEIDAVYRLIDSTVSDFRAKLEGVQLKLDNDVLRLEHSVKNVSVSESDFEFVGIIFVAFGVILNNLDWTPGLIACR